ncbi:MAG: c-type cytochrome, partial [Nitrospiraceae bacterium]
MGYVSRSVFIVTALMFLLSTFAVAAERNPLKARVPPAQRLAAKKMKNPVPMTKANVAKGKALFDGKGTCFTCHGKGGKGDGQAGKILNPSPRDFTNCKFHKRRKDGEFFWVIKNGSPGTGMVPLIPATI